MTNTILLFGEPRLVRQYRGLHLVSSLCEHLLWDSVFHSTVLSFVSEDFDAERQKAQVPKSGVLRDLEPAQFGVAEGMASAHQFCQSKRNLSVNSDKILCFLKTDGVREWVCVSYHAMHENSIPQLLVH